MPTALDALHSLFAEELRQPLYLTPREVAGGWRKLFPDPDTHLPAPYPIYSRDEEEVVARGYPVHVSDGWRQVRGEVERLVQLELEYRQQQWRGAGGDKSKVMAQRDRYLRSMSTILENTMQNDYDRRLLEVLVLLHCDDVSQRVARAPLLARRHDLEWGREHGDELRYNVAGVIADLLQRAAHEAADSLKRLARTSVAVRLSPLLGVVCHDRLLLSETSIPTGLGQLRGYLKVCLRQEPAPIERAVASASARLQALLHRRHELGGILGQAIGTDPNRRDLRLLLHARLYDVLRAAGCVDELGLSAGRMQLLRQLGIRLKRFELLTVLRRKVQPVELTEGGPVIAGRTPSVAISASTRPFDFTRPGVVDSAVRRFGLVYDLTSFTAQLEGVRRSGTIEEERALKFMYVFQSQLEEIRRRRRLTFEKFLGDGAFYSARRGLRVVAAACEIQRAYDHLRRSGFPFDRGLRIAMNFGTYRLLPMLGQTGDRRFEFFGHGIVELVRLTTGRSTREVEEIAEFLVHSGFDPSQVDSFLGPLLSARSGRPGGNGRTYAAWIDAQGELVNEGVVVNLPFLEELEPELAQVKPQTVDVDGVRWVAFPTDPGQEGSLHFGLRYLGVARLKGLAPLELVEATVFDELPADAAQVTEPEPLVTMLRRLSSDPDTQPDGITIQQIPPDLVVVTFLDQLERRTWIFGQYRASDDVLLHAIQIQLRPPDLSDSEALEMWLLRNRIELLQLYESLRRETSGASMPLEQLRPRDQYLACYLAAPHRAPG